MIEIIENTILEKAKEKFEMFQVESFPANFQKYNFTSAKGCILTSFESENVHNQETVTNTNSLAQYNFTVFLALRQLRKRSEANHNIKKLKKLLMGLPIADKRLKLNKVSFEAEIVNDVWYSFDVSIEFPETDDYKDESEASNIIGNLQNKEIENI